MKRVKWICMYICSEWMDRRMEARNSWQLVAGHGINMANLQRPGIVAPSMTYVFVPHANEPKFAKIQSWFSRLARTKTKTSSIAQHSGPNRKPNRSRNRRRWCQCLGPEAQKEPLSVIRHRWLSRSCWLHNHFASFFLTVMSQYFSSFFSAGSWPISVRITNLNCTTADKMLSNRNYASLAVWQKKFITNIGKKWVKNEGALQILWVVQQATRRVGRRLNISTTHWMDGWLEKTNEQRFFVRVVLFYKRKLMIFHELSDNKACIMSEKRK